jgi:threonine/homoserine/homoserine lactone efflux protein
VRSEGESAPGAREDAAARAARSAGRALAAGTVRAWLASSPRRLEFLGGTGGLVMIGIGARLALTGRND